MTETTTNMDDLIQAVKKILPKDSDEINIFKVLQCDGHEIRHSNLLGWLLDPQGTHGLGDKVLKDFLQNQCKYKTQDKSIELNNNVKIREEELSKNSRVDILLADKNEDFLILIENKWNSPTLIKQLLRYQNEIESKNSDFSKYKNKFYFILEKNDSASNDYPDNWGILNYKTDIMPLITNIQSSDERLNIIITDYKKVLNEIENENKLSKLCDLENNYPQEIDSIMNGADEKIDEPCVIEYIKEHFTTQKRLNRFINSHEFLSRLNSNGNDFNLLRNNRKISAMQIKNERIRNGVQFCLSADDKNSKIWVQIILDTEIIENKDLQDKIRKALGMGNRIKNLKGIRFTSNKSIKEIKDEIFNQLDKTSAEIKKKVEALNQISE